MAGRMTNKILPGELARRLARVEERRDGKVGLARFHDDPLGYCHHILQVTLTPDQERIARSLVQHPFKTLVRAGHNVGKSFVAACLVNWWYDTRRPGICLTTAPTERQVHDILWKEVRRLRGQRGGWQGPLGAGSTDAYYDPC